MLNVVRFKKTNINTAYASHIILFGSRLELTHDKLIEYYQLRFYRSFNFRDAKQFWGLEYFMNIKQDIVPMLLICLCLWSIFLRHNFEKKPAFLVKALIFFQLGFEPLNTTIQH